ncbi:MAG: aldehyde oxidase [Deltaproteobacteria bacterium RIFOXYA12_FULL_58_15]|nr:MAG: aldehyde oxidase [Deltaproteobacteria bacterium RIFOXYA12_FULL_58_15]
MTKTQKNTRENIQEKTQVVGKNVAKIDALSLACGAPMFTDDISTQGMLHAAILSSPHAHARITKIDTSVAEKIPGVRVILHHGNVPRVLHTTAGQGFPEPSPYDTALFDYKMRYVGDRVAAVAADSLEAAEQAVAAIKVEYDVLEPVFDIVTADAKGAPVIHDEPDAFVPIPVVYEPQKNIAAGIDAHAGDVKGALKGAYLRVAREFETHYAQHCPMEPHVCITYFDPDGRLVIRTSTQVPFHVRRIVSKVCEIPLHKVRVIKPRIGGGFGAKQEVFLEQVCAMLTIRTGWPVKIELTRAEEFIASRTRHPSVSRVEAGFDADGKILAIDMKIRTNTGAYGSHGLTVASNCGSKVLPLYPTENVSFAADSVYTNLPVAGAYRGYGATQAMFAMESVMDEAALKLGLDPLELKIKNHIRQGGTSPVFRMLGEGTEGVEQTVDSCGVAECIRIGAEKFDWAGRNKRRKAEGPWRRGFGVAVGMQGSSIPHIDMGAASIKMNEDGSFNLLMGATDIGTGSDTVLAQIAAEVLGVSLEKIVVYSSDTDMTPFDVGAYASSTTYLSGKAVEKTAIEVAKQIRAVAAEMMDVDAADIQLRDDKAISGKQSVTLAEVGERSLYTENQHQIGAISSHITDKSPPPFAAHFIEVDVDVETGKVLVNKYVIAVDCGTAINPQLAEGQCEGAVLNGLSFALTEEYIFDDKGRMRNPGFRDYKIFSTADLPEITTILVPTYEPSGPYGAKSVSEIGINGALPGLSNAIYDAVGVRLRTSPFTPERVLMALAQKDD